MFGKKVSGKTEVSLTKNTPTAEDDIAVTVDSDDLTTAEITESDGVEAPAVDDVAAIDESADDVAVDEAAEAADEAEVAAVLEPSAGGSRLLAYIVLPLLALALAAAAGYLGWRDYQARATDAARAESVQVAKDSTIKLLSYQPDTVEQELTAARGLLTGKFQDSYTQLTNDVVIPGAKQQRIAAIANVPAVASVSASPKHAVALVFVNQTVTVGDGAPTSTNSSVRVSMDKVGDHWLISEFEPI